MSRVKDALRIGVTAGAIGTALYAGSGQTNAEGPKVMPKKDGRTAQLRKAEQLPIESTLVPVTALNAQLDRVAGIADVSPTSDTQDYQVIRGAVGPDGILHLRTFNRGPLPLNEIGEAALSPIDAGLEIVMGADRELSSRQAQGGFTFNNTRNLGYLVVRNGIAEKPVMFENQTQNQIFNATFTPDGKYVVGKAIDSLQGSFSGLRILNVATGAVFRSDFSLAGPFETELRQTDTDTYVGYGPSFQLYGAAAKGQAERASASRNAQGGGIPVDQTLYGKFILDMKNGNVNYQAVALPDDINSYIESPYPLKQFKASNGHDKLWLWADDTSNNQNIATLVEVDLTTDTSRVIPLNPNLYTKDNVGFSGLVAKDTVGDLNFQSVYEYTSSPFSSASHIEWHQDKYAEQSWMHKQVPEDGDWAQIAESGISGMFVYNQDADRYLVAWSYEAGIITRRITNGISADNPWKLARNKTIAEELFVPANYRKAQPNSAYSTSELAQSSFSHPLFEADKRK